MEATKLAGMLTSSAGFNETLFEGFRVTVDEAVLLVSSSSMIFFLGSGELIDLFGEVAQPPAMGEPEE